MVRQKIESNKGDPSRIIAYYRVSTRRQAVSGLGIEGQKSALETYTRETKARLLAAYTEVESGRSNQRPELAKALAHARRSKATLVVAKLDRLSRNVAFLSALMESGVDFLACDSPYANRLTIHILAAVAEDEARRISERTKAALKAYKARGGKLGASLPNCRKLTLAARKKGATLAGATSKRQADEAYRDIESMLRGYHSRGFSLSAMARELMTLGHTTRRGKEWNHVQVKRVLCRLGLA